MNRTLLRSALPLAATFFLMAAGFFLTRGATGGDFFMPHAHCYLFNRDLMRLHGGADLLIGTAYVSISATLGWLVYRARRELPFHWIMIAFATFIVTCGATHFMELWTLTAAHPRYWLAGWVKLITAIASVTTAVVLPPLVPRILALLEAARLSAERRQALEGTYAEFNKRYTEEHSIDLAGMVRELVQAKEALQRKSAELAQQREWFRVTLASIGDAVITTDTGGKVTFLNPVAEALTGWKLADAAGQPMEKIFNIINEDTRQPVSHPIDKALREGVIVGLANHTTLIAQDGNETPVEDSAAPIRDGEGQIIGAVMVFHDVTARRRASNALADRARLAVLRAEISTALVSGDVLSAVLQKCTEALVKHLGAAFARIWTLNEAEGVLELNASAGLYTHLDGPHGRVKMGEFKIGRIAQSAQPLLTNDVRHDPNISDPAWARSEGMVAFAGYPLLLEGSVLGVVAVFARHPFSKEVFGELAPVTEAISQWVKRKRAEDALRGARDVAESANRAKDEFLAALSHELRTPLTPVLMLAADMEKSAELPAAVRADFAMIRKNVELEARLIDDLLDLTRITRGKLELRLEAVDVHGLITHALAILHSDREAKGIAVALDLAAAGHHVRGDAVRLQQVVWNVLKNAIKFTPEGGRISIRSWNEDGGLRVATADSGLGITAEEMPRIFTAFAQGREAAAARFGGLGLGLSITALLVAEHGGRIWAESAGRDQGATFHLALPLAAAPAPEQPAPPDAPVPAARPLHVLIAEDHADTRSILQRLMMRWGHRVAAAASVAQARAALAGGTFDLLLSDLGLPDGTGYEVIAAWREKSAAPAVAMSGYGMEADRARTLAAGFDEHLVKPVSADALRAMLARIPARPAPPEPSP